MKKTFLILLVSIVSFASCNKEDVKIGKFLSIRAAENYVQKSSGFTKSTAVHLTAREIVLQTFEIWWQNPEMLPYGYGKNGYFERDTIENRLKLESSYVIKEDGSLCTFLLNAKNVVLVRQTWYNEPYNHFVIDTIAYVPNTKVKEVGDAIKAAYNRDDKGSCYRLMDEGFLFIPITGKEMRDQNLIE